MNVLRLLLLPLLLLGDACQEILVEDIRQQPIRTMLPSPHYVLDSLDSAIYFWWDPVPGADDYHLQIVSPSWQAPQRMWLDTGVMENRLRWFLPPGPYEWRVQARNAGYQTEYFLRSLDVTQP